MENSRFQRNCSLKVSGNLESTPADPLIRVSISRSCNS
ncbi:Uncharacterised protein [Segatella copri]|nr:Uncharacterised protein [Segatella copri]